MNVILQSKISVKFSPCDFASIFIMLRNLGLSGRHVSDLIIKDNQQDSDDEDDDAKFVIEETIGEVVETEKIDQSGLLEGEDNQDHGKSLDIDITVDFVHFYTHQNYLIVNFV